MGLTPEDIEKYGLFARDFRFKGESVRERDAPRYRRGLQLLIDKGFIENPMSLKTGMDFECGRGVVTIAALPLFPNIHFFGVDIDSEWSYSALNEEERRRTTFVHNAVQRFVLTHPKGSLDIVLAGSIRVPSPDFDSDFDYQAFAGIVKPHRLVVELGPTHPIVPDFLQSEMEIHGFNLVQYPDPNHFQSWPINVWRKIG